MLENVTNWQ